MNTVLFAIWFFLPAGAANAAPILAAKLPYLSTFNATLDHGRYFKGKRIFGENKTWRGLFTGILVAVLIIYAQQLINRNTYLYFIPPQAENYLFNSPLLLGLFFGAGALLGDAVESFFKRQKNVAAGKTWFPFDQTDYIIGGCLAAALVVRLELAQYAVILAVWFVMHLVFSYIGYLQSSGAEE